MIGIDRIKDFIRGRDYSPELNDIFKESFFKSPNYEIFSNRNTLLRDIPLMLKDPIISSCLAIIMESAFPVSEGQGLVKINTPYEVIQKELEIFHKDYLIEDNMLVTAYNLLLYGNLPIKINFDETYTKFQGFKFVPDFRSVTPLIFNGKLVGHKYKEKFYDSFEFVYAQYLYYKDLGVNQFLFNFQFNEKEIENEFVYAPSYLSASVRPWRSIRVIEDALILQRLDVSNFMRIIGIKIGDNVFSKNAIKLMNFYRQIFKKVRRVSFDGEGMSNGSIGNEFEVVVPLGNNQDLDIKDIGGCLRGCTKVKLLNGENVAIKEMFDNKDKYLGKGIYTCSKDGTVGVSPITNITKNSCLEKDIKFVRVWLDNGEYFDVTPDHPCQMRHGEFREAQNLKFWDSLMPLYTNIDTSNKRGYERYIDNKTGKAVYTHYTVADFINGFSLPKTRKIHRHHKDRNKLNNDFSNIEILSSQEHYLYHKDSIRKATEKAALKVKVLGTTSKQRDAWRKNLIKARKIQVEKIKRDGISDKMYKSLVSRVPALNKARSDKFKRDGISDKQRESLLKNIKVAKKAYFEKIAKYGLSDNQIRAAKINIVKAIAKRHSLNSFVDLDIKCSQCGEFFKRHVSKSKLKGSVSDYLSKFRFCSISCKSTFFNLKKNEKAGVLNHKVVKVEWLNVIEDSYDLTVMTREHCFALSAGVFVHNTIDVKALKDLEIQYKKLFASLKVQPNYIGFEGEVPASLGESAVSRWDERFAKTVKALRWSTAKAIKKLDTIYLRSKGYNVTEDDFSFMFISASSVEEEELRLSQKTMMETISGIIQQMDSLNTDYDKDYLLKTLFSELFMSSHLDFDLLFKKKQKISSAITSGLLASDRLKNFEVFKEVGLITQAEYDKVSEKDRFIKSKLVNNTVPYDVYLSSADIFGDTDFNVDLSEKVIVKRINKQYFVKMDIRQKDIDKEAKNKNDRVDGIRLPFRPVVHSSASTFKASVLAQGRDFIIQNLYILQDGSYYFDRTDLINYLSLLESGQDMFFVKNIFNDRYNKRL